LELEDLERLPLPPPILSLTCPPTDSPLRRFIALKNDVLLVLGPRRLPPVDTPASNTYTSISILTSVGFRSLDILDYIDATQKLRPDIVIGCADVVHGLRRAGAGLKRMEKMGERSLAWMKGLLAGLRDAAVDDRKPTSIWAPILTGVS
jgi:queuine tRNA-ribosyltransferase subunit QTRTD1